MGCGLADDGDVDDVRDPVPSRRPEQAIGPPNIHLFGLTQRARGAMDYRVDIANVLFQPLSRQQVTLDRPARPLWLSTRTPAPVAPKRAATRRPSKPVPPVTRISDTSIL